MSEDRVEGVAEVVGGGGRAALAELGVGVVDSAAIENGLVGAKYDSFGCDGGFGDFDEAVVAVDDERRLDIEIVNVAARLGVGPIGIDLDQVKGEAWVLCAQAIEFRNVTVADGAIVAIEDENGSGVAGDVERLVWVAKNVEVLGRGRAGERQGQND